MKFLLDQSIEILERTPSMLSDLLSGLSDDWICNNEGKDTWSPFDVVGHLIHGEKTDWIIRTKTILFEDNKSFIPFDRFAQFEASKGKSMTDLLTEFELLRNQNILELKSFELSDSDLMKTGVHPEFGEVTLRQLLACWVTHDLGHINQITRVMAKNYAEEVGPWRKYLKVVS